MVLATILLLPLFLEAVVAEIPQDYILKIVPTCYGTCGGDVESEGCVKIITDLNADAKAVCKGGTSLSFATTDGVNFHLPFNYNPGELCQFERRVGSRVFVAKVIVSYGEKTNMVHEYEEEFTITCTFDNKASNTSQSHTVDDTLIAPKEIQTNKGADTASSVTLEIVDVLGDDLSGTNIDLGRPVSIKASSTGSENGLKVVSCDAMNSTGGRYAFLRAGCGDGIIFDQTEGFVSKGKQLRSPYFEMFSVGGDTTMQLECNFTLCASTCDGSSCSNAARKRRESEKEVRAIREFHLWSQKMGSWVADVAAGETDTQV